jgi:hypothetical protein
MDSFTSADSPFGLPIYHAQFLEKYLLFDLLSPQYHPVFPDASAWQVGSAAFHFRARNGLMVRATQRA